MDKGTRSRGRYLRTMRATPLVLVALLLVHPALAQFEKLEARSRAALAADKPYKALTFTERALTRKGAPPHFHLIRAEAFNRIGEYGRALEELNKVPELRHDPEYRTDLIGSLTGSARIDSALSLIQPTIPSGASAEYLYRAGRVLVLRDRWSEALEHFDAGVMKEPGSPRMYRERGACHAMLGEHDKAKADLDEAVRLAPRDASNYNSRGYYLHIQHGDHRSAIADLDRAIKQDPNYGFAFSNRGWCWFQIGDTAKALRDLRLAVRKTPSNSYAFRNLGIVELAMGDQEKGCADLRLALNLGFTDRYGKEVQERVERDCSGASAPMPTPVSSPLNAPGNNAPEAPKGRTNAP